MLNVTRRCEGSASKSKSLGRHDRPVEQSHLPRELLAQVGRRQVHRVDQARGELSRGHELAPEPLGQRADQLGDQLDAVPGHVPVERAVIDAHEAFERQVDRDAVVAHAGLERIRQRIGLTIGVPLARELVLIDEAWLSIAGSNVSRSGWSRLAFFHHESKCRVETTSAGMRWS